MASIYVCGIYLICIHLRVKYTNFTGDNTIIIMCMSSHERVIISLSVLFYHLVWNMLITFIIFLPVDTLSSVRHTDSSKLNLLQLVKERILRYVFSYRLA